MSGLPKSAGQIRAGEKGNELRLLVLEKRPLLENVPAPGVLHQCRALVQRAQVSLPAQSDRRESIVGIGMSVHRGLATLTTAAGMARWRPRALDNSSTVLTASRAPPREQGRSLSSCQWELEALTSLSASIVFPETLLGPPRKGRSQDCLWVMGFDLSFLYAFKKPIEPTPMWSSFFGEDPYS